MTRPNERGGKHAFKKSRYLLVLSAAQYSQVIRIFNMLTSCYKMLSDPHRNSFIT